MNPTRQIHFLIIEDDDNHAEIIRRSLRRNPIVGSFDRVTDGAEALAYLHRESRFADRPMPDVILLDLKLPKVDGHEVLSIIKQDPALQTIPVVVLSTSDAAQDRATAYRHNANSFLVKPISYEQFRELLDRVCAYWGGAESASRRYDEPQTGRRRPLMHRKIKETRDISARKARSNGAATLVGFGNFLQRGSMSLCMDSSQSSPLSVSDIETYRDYLRFLRGSRCAMNYEIANEIGMSTTAVAGLAFRGLRTLRKKLETP